MSPFEIFRRNLKPMMVFLTALALFAFVVLPAIAAYLQSGGGRVLTPQVAVFDGIPVTQGRVDYLTRNHRRRSGFPRELADRNDPPRRCHPDARFRLRQPNRTDIAIDRN